MFFRFFFFFFPPRLFASVLRVHTRGHLNLTWYLSDTTFNQFEASGRAELQIHVALSRFFPSPVSPMGWLYLSCFVCFLR